MNYFSMFSGIGGFENGIQNACSKQFQSQGGGWNVNKETENIGHSSSITGKGWGNSSVLCIGYSEINKYAIQCYEHHFKGHKNYGDANTIEWGNVPDFDLLVAGFPCQAFSIAGKRQGFNDTRGTLFFQIERACRTKKPKYILLENVKGLLSHDDGRTFQTIIKILTDIGYILQWQVLNSKDFGVPQNRERVFIVGHLRGECFREVFPIGGSNGKALEQIITGGQGNRVYSVEGLSTTIASQAGGQGAKTGLYAIPVLTPDRPEKRQNGRRMKEDGDPAFTLTAQDKHGVFDGYRIRRLTPTECERLQSFPDGWTAMLSDTQRYKCLGNSVTCNVIEEIIHKMFK